MMSHFALSPLFGTPFQKTGSHSLLAYDFIDTPDAYNIYVDMPGFSASDITAELNDATFELTVSGYHPTIHEEREEGDFYHMIERPHGIVSRTIPIPVFAHKWICMDSSHEHCKSEYSNGVLHFSFPKLNPQRTSMSRVLPISHGVRAGSDRGTDETKADSSLPSTPPRPSFTSMGQGL